MENNFKSVCQWVGFLIFVASAGQAFAAVENRVGFVDVAKAFDSYQKTKDADSVMEKKGEAKQQEREKKVAAVKKLKDEMELLSEEARRKKQTEMDQTLRDLQDFDSKVRDELRRERDSIVRDILKEIDELIGEYGDKNGFSMILNDRVLLYGRQEMDVTTQIIQLLNERYNSKKK
ncbi:MAG: OmpH family outer membrane protein [Candidatus Omnitrophica bacterium]|nr:OmpH family outer membrane protein [Candidatus Omnitrophota bacterium]